MTVEGFIEDWYGTGDTRVLFSDGSLGHILGETGVEGSDTAVYRGNRDDYRIEMVMLNGQQAIRITDLRPATDGNGNATETDGVDILVGMDRAEFADQTVSLDVGPMSDISWEALSAGGRIARLSTDAPFDTQASFELLSTSNASITLTPGDGTNNEVRLQSGLPGGNVETVEIRATDIGGTQVTETFEIVTGRATDDVIDRSASSNDNVIYGRAGNDTITGGSGNDAILWNVTNPRPNRPARSDGRDFVDGGGNGAAGDRFTITGNRTSETFAIYTVAAAMAAGLSVENAAAEIVVTRNGEVIAELANVEEITINTRDVTANDNNGGLNGGGVGGRGDTVQIVGDFSGTSLNYSTITVNGDEGDDTVDISGLASDHRIVFHGGGGDNVVIGQNRTQDVLENARHEASSAQEGEDGDDGDDASAPDAGMPQTDGLVLVGDATGETFIGAGMNDVVFAGDGADNALGNAGDDLLFGDGGNDRLFGGDGDDVIEAGAGDDMVFADDGDDLVIATEGDGRDSYWGGEGTDTIDYAAVSASVEVDLGHGAMGHGQVMIGTEADQIYSFENVITGSGDDKITANAAVNVMDGGGGNDTFVFGSAADADGDRILGFAPGDKIDLSGIDADQGTAGNQSFVLFAAGDFSAAGQLRISHEMRGDGEHTLITGNVNDDPDADFEIDLLGHHDPDGSDFNGLN